MQVTLWASEKKKKKPTWEIKPSYKGPGAGLSPGYLLLDNMAWEQGLARLQSIVWEETSSWGLLMEETREGKGQMESEFTVFSVGLASWFS